MRKTCYEHYCARWLKVSYIMAKNCNMVVFQHNCYPIKVNFIVYIFLKNSLCWVKRCHIPCLGDHFCYFCVVSGYVKIVQPWRVSGLPVILYPDSHIRVRFGLVLFSSSYVPWILHKWNPGGCTDRRLQNASAWTGISACVKHGLSGHIKI